MKKFSTFSRFLFYYIFIIWIFLLYSSSNFNFLFWIVASSTYGFTISFINSFISVDCFSIFIFLLSALASYINSFISLLNLLVSFSVRFMSSDFSIIFLFGSVNNNSCFACIIVSGVLNSCDAFCTNSVCFSYKIVEKPPKK